MAEVSVVHLVWAPLGTPALERFLASYRAHPAGLPHRLMIVLKGFAKPEDASGHLQLLEGIDYDSMFYALPTLDLPAYRAAAEALAASHLCFLNSESVLLAPGWLRTLYEAVADPGVGIAGATASYERIHSLIPARRRRWPPFPNPHVRTNAFMLSRELLLSARWPDVATKARAWELESGVDSLTRHAWSRGLGARVVGRDGTAYRPHEWPASATFRSGAQANLLVADNRTREWDAAGASERAKLTRRTWGADPAATAAAVLRATVASTA
ncbi:MAG: hypothetical protein QOI71_3276 [Gaiellales bacterium]|jgi:hypothetical protein|nr:hypothetical protein [Gaiellales bacterium]